MYLSPNDDPRKWRLYDTHRYPIGAKSTYVHSRKFDAVALKHTLLAVMSVAAGMKIIMA